MKNLSIKLAIGYMSLLIMSMMIVGLFFWQQHLGVMAHVLQLLLLIIMIFIFVKIHSIRKKNWSFEKGYYHVTDFDEIAGLDFEEVVCDILVANGFEHAENTPSTKDFGIDVLARKDGITYAIQCKRYQTTVGIEAVQQAFAGRAYYECHVAVVLTNQYFTSHAKMLADKIGVVLWDRDYLEELLS